MLKSVTALVGSAFLALTCLGAAPAVAHNVTFVSGTGTDTGDCTSPSSPCRTFQFAVDHADAGGEVKALDPAEYGPVTITKSISIEGVDGAGINTGINPGLGSVAITITAASNDAITLTNLILNGLPGGEGIRFNSGGSLTVTHCTVQNFGGAGSGQGVFLTPSSSQTRFLISDTVLANDFRGFTIASPSNASTNGPAQTLGTLDHVLLHNNSASGALLGVTLDSAAVTDVTIVDSVATNNGQGFVVQQGTLRLAHSTSTENQTNDVQITGGTATSFGDNHFTKVVGTLTQVGTQ